MTLSCFACSPCRRGSAAIRPRLAPTTGRLRFCASKNLQAMMQGDVVQAMELANDLDPTMLDGDRCALRCRAQPAGDELALARNQPPPRAVNRLATVWKRRCCRYQEWQLMCLLCSVLLYFEVVSCTTCRNVPVSGAAGGTACDRPARYLALDMYSPLRASEPPRGAFQVSSSSSRET